MRNPQWTGSGISPYGVLGLAVLLGALAMAVLAWRHQIRALGHLHLQALARDLEAKVKVRTAELQESQARLLGFLRHAPTAIVLKDLEGRFILVNPRFEQLLGMPESEIIGKRLPDLISPELCSPWLEQERRVLELREEVQHEEAWPRPDGQPGHFLVQEFPLIDSGGQSWGMGVILTDITERREAERVHLQNQKLESLGILAGGLAHDFNNLLGAMEGNVELARVETEPGAPVQPYLEALEGLIGRADRLVRQILAYSGRSQAKIVAMDLNQQVEDMTRLLRAALSRKALLRLAPDPGLPPIQADPAQLQQVLMNLVLNASEAVEPQSGVITLRTGREWLDAAAIHSAFRGQALEPGPHVFLEVADNGPGMSPEVLERIFDPFFTTKFTGRGLGLSAVLGILRAHRGGILVRSETGKGTTFRLLFPADMEANLTEDPPPPDFETAIGAYRGTGTVLVVDDEEPLRATAQEALRRMGFTTLEARDGLEALQVFEANRDQIRLILMDCTMPRLDGEEAYRELRSIGMQVPVILTSGFSETEILQHCQSRGIAGFLQKPYPLQALVQVIRKTLEEKGAEPFRGLAPRQPLAADRNQELGFSMLDNQHRELLDRYNRIAATLTRAGQGQEAARQLTALKETALSHFGVEETLMRRLAFPGIRKHQASHARLISQINSISDRIQRGDLAFTPNLLDFLECWLVHHTQEDDRRLGLFLKDQGH